MTIIISFLAFLGIILAVGLYAKHFSKNTSKDYLLASGQVPVWQATISALASTYSGFMYIGLIGYTYIQGISAIWLILFLMIGQFFVFHFAPKKISQVTKKRNLSSYSDLISNYWGDNQYWSKKVVAIITLVFLSLYAAAQFNAAGKTLHSLLDWHTQIGIVMSYIIVLAYCFSGGIRASIWTDVIQFALMVISIAILVYVTLSTIGGWQNFIDKLYENPASYTEFFPDSMGGLFFIIIFLLGWAVGGIGALGQPHISVRYMVFKEIKNHRQMIFLYYISSFTLSLLCLLSALLAKVYFAEVSIGDFDTETALPRLAIAVLPSILVGLMLSGIFAAIVSTADSQILSCSAALGTDLLKEQKNDQAKLRQNKFTTVLVATFALLVAALGGQSVFSLVIIAWSGLASAFTPILLLYFLGYKIPQHVNIMMIIAGLSAAIIWRILGLNTITYDALIGIVVGFLIFFIAKQIIPIVRVNNE